MCERASQPGGGEFVREGTCPSEASVRKAPVWGAFSEELVRGGAFVRTALRPHVGRMAGSVRPYRPRL